MSSVDHENDEQSLSLKRSASLNNLSPHRKSFAIISWMELSDHEHYRMQSTQVIRPAILSRHVTSLLWTQQIKKTTNKFRIYKGVKINASALRYFVPPTRNCVTHRRHDVIIKCQVCHAIQLQSHKTGKAASNFEVVTWLGRIFFILCCVPQRKFEAKYLFAVWIVEPELVVLDPDCK